MGTLVGTLRFAHPTLDEMAKRKMLERKNEQESQSEILSEICETYHTKSGEIFIGSSDNIRFYLSEKLEDLRFYDNFFAISSHFDQLIFRFSNNRDAMNYLMEIKDSMYGNKWATQVIYYGQYIIFSGFRFMKERIQSFINQELKLSSKMEDTYFHASQCFIDEFPDKYLPISVKKSIQDSLNYHVKDYIEEILNLKKYRPHFFIVFFHPDLFDLFSALIITRGQGRLYGFFSYEKTPELFLSYLEKNKDLSFFKNLLNTSISPTEEGYVHRICVQYSEKRKFREFHQWLRSINLTLPTDLVENSGMLSLFTYSVGQAYVKYVLTATSEKLRQEKLQEIFRQCCKGYAYLLDRYLLDDMCNWLETIGYRAPHPYGLDLKKLNAVYHFSIRKEKKYAAACGCDSSSLLWKTAKALVMKHEGVKDLPPDLNRVVVQAGKFLDSPYRFFYQRQIALEEEDKEEKIEVESKLHHEDDIQQQGYSLPCVIL